MDSGLTAAARDEARPPDHSGLWGLGLVLAALLLALAGVVVLAREAPAPARNRFDRAPLKAMRKVKPDYVLIGNSMVKTRFTDRDLNRALAGKRALIVANDSSRSAMWYAMFKNYVIASGQRPRRVLFFFRDLELTAPTAGTLGDGRWRLERVSLAEEPVIDARLSPRWTDPVDRLRHELEASAPIARLRERTSPVIDRFGLWLAGQVSGGEG
jgi:hypothetical protein